MLSQESEVTPKDEATASHRENRALIYEAKANLT